MNVNRRSVISLGALIGTGTLITTQESVANFLFGKDEPSDSTNLGRKINSEVCTKAPDQVKGPYHLESPERSNIQENRNGLPLNLKIQIVSATSCQPLNNAIVEIWHADNRGNYSGFRESRGRRDYDIFDTSGLVYTSNSDTYLRGGQFTDSNGIVEFQTVFPRWYESRITHIHIRIHYQNKTKLTSQLYFDDEIVKSIYSNHPDYKPFGIVPHSFKTDFISRRSSNKNRLLLHTDEITNGLNAEIKLGVS
jgi:protocatechuate 3,4-dioxygenase beta subunit